jgi:hypothetical protein
LTHDRCAIGRTSLLLYLRGRLQATRSLTTKPQHEHKPLALGALIWLTSTSYSRLLDTCA